MSVMSDLLLLGPILGAKMSQCLSGSGCSKDQENYDWTTAELISQLFIEVTSTAHSLYRNSAQTCRWFYKNKDTNKVYKLPLF